MTSKVPTHCVAALAEFPTNVLEMTAVAAIFDTNGDGFIDYCEFVSALHPSRDPLRRGADADQIQDEVGQPCCPRGWGRGSRHGSEPCLPSPGQQAGGPVQLRQTLPGGADQCQQVPGKCQCTLALPPPQLAAPKLASTASHGLMSHGVTGPSGHT